MSNANEHERLWTAKDLLRKAQLALPVSGVGTYAPANKAITRALRKVDKQIEREAAEFIASAKGPKFLGPHVIGEPGIAHSTNAPKFVEGEITLERAFNLMGSRGRDAAILDQIARELDGVEWDPDTIADIATLVRESGRAVRDPEEVEDEREDALVARYGEAVAKAINVLMEHRVTVEQCNDDLPYDVLHACIYASIALDRSEHVHSAGVQGWRKWLHEQHLPTRYVPGEDSPLPYFEEA